MAARRTPSSGLDDLRRRARKRDARMFVDLLARMELGDTALLHDVTRMLGSSWTEEYRSEIADQLVMLASIAVKDPAAWAAILAEHLLCVSLEDPAAYATLVEREERARRPCASGPRLGSRICGWSPSGPSRQHHSLNLTRITPLRGKRGKTPGTQVQQNKGPC